MDLLISLTNGAFPISRAQANEEVLGLNKKLEQIDNELKVAQEDLEHTNVKLEDKEKNLTNVSTKASGKPVQVNENRAVGDSKSPVAPRSE